MLSSDFSVYPNPARDYILIKNERLEGEVIQILDLAGKLIIQSTIQSFENKINIEDLESGIYFVKVGTQSEKLIIE